MDTGLLLSFNPIADCCHWLLIISAFWLGLDFHSLHIEIFLGDLNDTWFVMPEFGGGCSWFKGSVESQAWWWGPCGSSVDLTDKLMVWLRYWRMEEVLLPTRMSFLSIPVSLGHAPLAQRTLLLGLKTLIPESWESLALPYLVYEEFFLETLRSSGTGGRIFKRWQVLI